MDEAFRYSDVKYNLLTKLISVKKTSFLFKKQIFFLKITKKVVYCKYNHKTKVIKLFKSHRRKSRFENRYHPKMGRLSAQVTRIQQCILGIPFKTIHKYRETYNGEIKDCKDCNISRI